MSWFRDWLTKTARPEFEGLATRLLEEAGQDLRDAVPPRGDEGEEEGWMASVLRPLGVAPEVAIPAVGIGIGLYLIFAVAVTTATSFFFFRTTSVNLRTLIGGVIVVVVCALFLLSFPARLLQRKRARLLRRYDAYLSREISSPGGPSNDDDTLEARLVGAIRRRAEELEAGLPDE